MGIEWVEYPCKGMVTTSHESTSPIACCPLPIALSLCPW
jgi:hypothetical protein